MMGSKMRETFCATFPSYEMEAVARDQNAREYIQLFTPEKHASADLDKASIGR